jgi:hypothetical protein
MKFILIIVFSLNIHFLTGQQNIPDSILFSNHIFDGNIKSVQLYREGWNLSYPVIKLNGNEKLVLHFDLLNDRPESYDYTIIHCDKDWRKTDIFYSEYLDGFPENPVEDYKASFNTTVGYFHYKVSFPNDRVKMKISGNYILRVYPAGKADEPAITRRFVVTEDAAGIKVSAHRPQMTKNNNTHQQIDFIISHPNLALTDPIRNIYAFILQNGRWDNAIRNLKPEFYGNNELKYNSLSDKNIFAGGNEFRYFDIKSIRYQTEFVARIDYLFPNYSIYLTKSESREFKPYFYWQDFNGKYYVAVQEGRNPDTDADYVNVFFTLKSSQPVQGGNMYVSGELNDWTFDRNNLMVYNQSKGQYECNMFLKQGWYNYEYIFMKTGEKSAQPSEMEGSHYETENDYMVLVYYRNPRDRYDRLVASAIHNTLNKMVN